MRFDDQRPLGFTMVELLLAMALMSVLMIGLVRLLDTSLTIWDRTESDRDALELGSSLLELAARDFATLEGSEDGDLVYDWVRRDTDANGVADLLVPRFVARRQADAAELVRAGTGVDVDPWQVGLLEVCWVLRPAGGADPDVRNVGVLARGERLAGADDGVLSFFDDTFFSALGDPPPGTVRELSGGVLWFAVTFASPTSVLHSPSDGGSEGGWRVGDALADCASAWDAWGRGRPELEISDWNTLPSGVPAADVVPNLPRRVRIEIELERPVDRKRRPRLTRAVDATEREFPITHPERVPLDAHVLLGEEWVRVVSRGRARISVERGQRGTRAQVHDESTMLHFGTRLVRDVPVAQGRGAW